MRERGKISQDLNQVLGTELAGSATGRNQCRQSDLVHTLLLSQKIVPNPVLKRE